MFPIPNIDNSSKTYEPFCYKCNERLTPSGGEVSLYRASKFHLFTCFNCNYTIKLVLKHTNHPH